MGTAQGSPLSPWLATVLLDDLDKAWERRGHRVTRYADDLLVLVKRARAGTRVKASLTRVLTTQLKLSVNASKSRGWRTAAVVCLGFTCRGTKRRWSDAAFADVKHRIRHLTGHSWGVSRAYRLARRARYIQGWMQYFGISDDYRPLPEVDHWRRRRIRMGSGKQWRRGRTNVRHLRALGTGKRPASLTALRAKGYWHRSKTLATQSGMTTAWLPRQGLISGRDLWLQAPG
jgi:RNA-directed DNA polymerase